MTMFSLIPARAHHCGQMCRLLRHEHARAIAAIGIEPHRALRHYFDQSSIRKAWLIDGKLAGLGGVTGTKMASTGFVWLALSSAAMKYPIKIVKTARAQLDEIMTIKHDLVTTIIDGDEAAQRLAVFLGFTPSGTEWHRAASSRHGRNAVNDSIARSADARLPLGNGYVTAMHYEEARD